MPGLLFLSNGINLAISCRWWLSRSKSDVENHLLSNSEDHDDYVDVSSPIVYNGKVNGGKISIVPSKVENSPV